MKDLAFFSKKLGTSGKGGSGLIRAVQIAEHLGAKLNPGKDYKNGVCIYVKAEPPENFPKHSYLDVMDTDGRNRWLKKHPEIGVIACSEAARSHLSKVLKRDDVVVIPQHHCNYDRVKRDRKEMLVVGVIGRPSSMDLDINDLKKRLRKIGMEFVMTSKYRGREDVVDFYKKIDIQIIWRKENKPFKNALKIVNAASFGIPTVAYPEQGYMEMEGYYLRAKTIDKLIDEVKDLKGGWHTQRLIDKAEEYHIDNIAELYKKLK